MPMQLSFAEARRHRGLRVAILPDGARVEERLLQLSRERTVVAGKMACTLAELERELVREARRAGACPPPASPWLLQLALREAAREHSHGPWHAIRNQPGYERALGDLLAALTEGLIHPAELLSLDVPERVRAAGRTLEAAREALRRAGAADPHLALRLPGAADPPLALRLAVEQLEARGVLPGFLAGAAELPFDGILDWTPLRLRL